MIKILLKTLILVCIILSIYFIVNPSACSNLMSGKVVNSTEKLPTFVPKEQNHSELLTPKGDQPLHQEEKPAKTAVEEQSAEQPENTEEAAADAQTQSTEQQPEQTATPVTDTNSLQTPTPAEQKPGYSVAEIDYAIANRYVELENEYIKQKKDMKKAAQEISYIVMDDFEMTPSEWEAFLQRATADNLFEKVRAEQAAKK